jgi:hypothetical protein
VSEHLGPYRAPPPSGATVEAPPEGDREGCGLLVLSGIIGVVPWITFACGAGWSPAALGVATLFVAFAITRSTCT